MAENRRAKQVILFSLDPGGPAIAEHCAAGGVAYVLAGSGPDGQMERRGGARRDALLGMCDLPIALGGAARYNVANALAAMALAEGLGVPLTVLGEAVQTFASDFRCNPGRMNRYSELPFEVVLDYAHNLPGLQEVLPVLADIPATGRRICCAILSGRGHDDAKLQEIAACLAPHFACFVPSNMANPARRRGELPEVLRQAFLDAGIADENIRPCQNEQEAVRTALDWAEPGDLVVIFAGEQERKVWMQVTSYVPRPVEPEAAHQAAALSTVS